MARDSARKSSVGRYRNSGALQSEGQVHAVIGWVTQIAGERERCRCQGTIGDIVHRDRSQVRKTSAGLGSGELKALDPKPERVGQFDGISSGASRLARPIMPNAARCLPRARAI